MTSPGASRVTICNQKTTLLDIFTKGEIEDYKFEGRQAIIPLHKSRNSGVKATGEGGVLPAAGKQGYADLKVPMRFISARIEITTQLMKAARSDRGSFARAMDSEQQGLVKDMSRQRNRAFAGFGSGTLATISSGTNSATQTVTAPGGVAGSTNVLRFLPIGTVVAITDSTGAVLRAVQTITSQTGTTQIVLDAAVNTTTGDLISLGTNATTPGESSFNLEPMGLLGIDDATTFVSSIHGIDRSLAANAFFKSTVLTSVGTLSPDLLNRAIDNTEEVSGELITDFLGHYSLRREFLKLTEADRRYENSASDKGANFDAGNKASKTDPTFSGRPFRADKDLPYATLFGVCKDHLYWLPESEGEWADEDGSVLFRVQNKDNFEARYRVYENAFSDMGNSHFRLDGVSASVTSGIFSL